MGVRGCFGRLYGPDLVNTFKEGPEFYRRIFADAGVSTSEAWAVDDNPVVINWAAQAGAKTVLIGSAVGDECNPDLIVASLAELPRSIPPSCPGFGG